MSDTEWTDVGGRALLLACAGGTCVYGWRWHWVGGGGCRQLCATAAGPARVRFEPDNHPPPSPPPPALCCPVFPADAIPRRHLTSRCQPEHLRGRGASGRCGLVVGVEGGGGLYGPSKPPGKPLPPVPNPPRATSLGGACAVACLARPPCFSFITVYVGGWPRMGVQRRVAPSPCRGEPQAAGEGVCFPRPRRLVCKPVPPAPPPVPPWTPVSPSRCHACCCGTRVRRSPRSPFRWRGQCWARWFSGTAVAR
jgi:hypothetical protein